MMQSRIKIIFCIVALVLTASLFLRQQYIHRSLHSENAVLREQTTRLRDLEHLREENRRLTALQADAAELERLRAEEASLKSLEREADLLRRQLFERAAQREKASTNDSAGSWTVGQSLARDAWKEAGQASPIATFQTYLAAITKGDIERLKKCASIGVPPGYTNDFYAWAVKHRQDDWAYAQSVQLVSESRREQNFAEIQVQFTSFVPAQVAASGKDVVETREKEQFRFVRTGDQWKLELHTPPQTIEIVLSTDPAERARQIAELPSRYQDMLKAAPAGRKLTIRQFGLPGPPPGAEGLRP